jgi:hypothetical protein
VLYVNLYLLLRLEVNSVQCSLIVNRLAFQFCLFVKLFCHIELLTKKNKLKNKYHLTRSTSCPIF